MTIPVRIPPLGKNGSRIARCLRWGACVPLAVFAACSPANPPASVGEETVRGKAVPVLAFTDVTEQAGLAGFRHVTGAFGNHWFPEAMGSGGGFVDYDNDGWIDILLAGGGVWPEHADEPRAPVEAIRLYRNEGNGAFREVTQEVGLAGFYAYGIGVATADYDNDGDQDIYLTTLGENLFFRNDAGPGGMRTFSETGSRTGVAGSPQWSTSAIFFDADRDGHVDLYVGNYVAWSPGADLVCMLGGRIRSYCTPELYEGVPSRFYRNDGNGMFVDWTEQAGFLPAPGKMLGVSEWDFNKDRWPDLVVASDTQRDLFYLNDGDGTFTEQGALSGMAYDENGKARAGMGIDVGVVDESGEATLFVGNFSKEMISVFRHDGKGLFLDRSAVSQIGRPSLLTLTFGLFLFDADLDGDMDLFAANGHVQPEIEQTQEGIPYAEPPHLFLNRGEGIFEDAAPILGGPLARSMVGRGAAYADYDRDGDLDILITENGGGAWLLRNDLAGGRPLRVRLEGRNSNRDGLSARVVARVGGRRMERFVRTGSSFLSASEKVVTFGLGEADRVDSLAVYWPSGQEDWYAEVASGNVLVVEGADSIVASPFIGLPDAPIHATDRSDTLAAGSFALPAARSR